MTLAGTRLGPYDILALVGVGGMGEVYRARDARLNRDVAIKVLPSAFANDASRLARFGSEAQVLASLNHSNIAAIYGLEESGGVQALILEFVEGPTLADRIAEGPIPCSEAVPIAHQLSLALESAHERGIVHRDLKPANIKVRPDGTVKVLDFGLAKALEAPGVADPANSPTITSPHATAVGVLLGTAAYMSPEQARGERADPRSDIWAFGAVLYEMLTGRPAFRGSSVSELLASVLRDEPDWTALPADTPPRISWLLRRCLTKQRTQRLCHIGDARWELEQPLDPPAAAPPRSRSRIPWAVAALAAVLAAIGWLWPRQGTSVPANIAFTIGPPPGTALSGAGTLASAPEISPDGTSVLYYTANGVYLRRFDAVNATRVIAPGAVTNAFFWSADSTAVAYPSSDAQLIKVRLPDGAPEVIAPLPLGSRGGSWSDNGAILIGGGALRLVSASGGEVKDLPVPGLPPGMLYYPEFLPGGEEFLFLFAPAEREEHEIYLARLRDGAVSDPVLLLKNETAVRYTPAAGGRVLFVRNDNLYSQRLNRRSRGLEGEAELLIAGVTSQPGSQIYRADFSVSRTGAVAHRAGTAALAEATAFDRSGKAVGTLGRPASLQALILSPDETQLLAAGSDRAWVLDVKQGGASPLPYSTVRWFGWSDDGASLLGAANQRRIVQRAVNGPADVRELGSYATPFGVPQDVSADGKTILTMLFGGNGILVVEAGSGGSSRQLTETGQFAAGARFSPDGQWMVYEGGDRTSGALYVQPVQRPGRRTQIASRGRYAEWRRDGKEIVFWSLPSASLMSVSVTAGRDGLQFADPQPLFAGLRLAPGTTLNSRPLAVSKDGSRVFFAQAVEQPNANVIHIATTWPGR